MEILTIWSVVMGTVDTIPIWHDTLLFILNDTISLCCAIRIFWFFLAFTAYICLQILFIIIG